MVETYYYDCNCQNLPYTKIHGERGFHQVGLKMFELVFLMLYAAFDLNK